MASRVVYSVVLMLLMCEFLQVSCRLCVRWGYTCRATGPGCARRGPNHACLRIGSGCRCRSSVIVGSFAPGEEQPVNVY